MGKQYSHLRAMWAITKASLRAILRSPSAVVFSIFFPLIFILIFGFVGNSGGPNYKVVLASGSDTTNAVYDSLKKIKAVRFVTYPDSLKLRSDLNKGRITGVLLIINKSGTPQGPFLLQFKSTTASADKFSTFLPLLENIVNKVDRQTFAGRQSVAYVIPQIEEVRQYRTIDFILPGQLGFSLLSAGVFGVAFLFVSLRQQLVLKRFFATPVNRTYLVLGEGLSRVIFQLLTAVIIVGLGYFFFNFTLVHGWITFIEILILSFIALLVFIGFGFVVSGVAGNESSIPPIANLFTLPQFLLAGTFFSVDAFPAWLQPISKALPLTYFNNAMRKISFEGAHLTDCGLELGVLALWGVIAYALAVKFFRWE